MKNHNCPNCGAPYDNRTVKCPYCETLYYDLSAISLNVPFMLTINTGTEDNPKIVTSKVVCSQIGMTTAPSPYKQGEPVCRITPDITFDLQFQAIGDISAFENKEAE